MGGNVIGASDRGVYLFDAWQNQLRRNDVRESLQSVLAVDPAGNTIEENNFVHSVLPAMEDGQECLTDTRQPNSWEGAPRAVEDGHPAEQAWADLTVSVPDFQPVEFGEVRCDVL